MATGLLAMWQSTAWLGAEVGLFKKRGIDMTLPAISVGGPEAAAGLIRGDWEFAQRDRAGRGRSAQGAGHRDLGDADVDFPIPS